MHLLQQDIPQPVFVLPSTGPFGFCTLPVFHIHEIPFQHFGKELAKETLLAFHCEPALKSEKLP